MSKVNTRRLVIVLAIGILVGAFFVMKYMQEANQAPRQTPAPTPTPEVEVMAAQNGAIASTLDVQGALVAFNKIDLFTEVSGTLEGSDRPFKIGSYFPKGAVLIKIDKTEAQLNLLSQKSSLLNAITQLMPDLKIDYTESFQQWKTYLDQFDVEKPLQAFPEPLNDQEKYFIASRNLLSQYYTIQSAEERLSKYIVKAPFSGVITQTSIQPGALVRAGQKLGELMNTSSYELQVTVPLSDLEYLSKGSKVALTSRDIEGSWTGTVRRINDQVDAGTQTVKVFIAVSGKNLREGMYMTGDVDAKPIQNAISIPRNLLINQNSVYAVHENSLELRPVEVVKVTEKEAIVRGIKDGTFLLKGKLPNAFEGMKVETKHKAKAISSNSNPGVAAGGQ
ncbi:MAG: efflux RND transporter periplasmic adaptor subunit [Saprospiraceae bacterium]